MSASHSLKDQVVEGEDEETESESEIEYIEDNDSATSDGTQHVQVTDDEEKQKVTENSEPNEITNESNVKAPSSDVNENKESTTSSIKRMPTASKTPHFKEIKTMKTWTPSLESMKVGLNKMITSGKEMVVKNLKQTPRAKTGSAILNANILFHEKTLKALSVNLNTYKKQSEKVMIQCEQSVSDLNQAKGKMTNATRTLDSFCCESDKYVLHKLF